MFVLAAGLVLYIGLALTLRKRRREVGVPGTDTNRVAPPAGATVPVLGYIGLDGVAGATTNGHELPEQAKRIAAECDRRGLWLLELVRDGDPSQGGEYKRPGLSYALERIASGEVKGLVVTELPLLAPSLPELGRILAWLLESGTRLVVVSQGLDTAERDGVATIRALIEISSWQQERVMVRTPQGARPARRKGRPAVADKPELRLRIEQMRSQGMTLRAIANQLNADRVPTVRGGAEWRPSSVQAAVGYKRPRAGRVNGRRGAI